MKKKNKLILLSFFLFILVSSQTIASLVTMTLTKADGTIYTMAADSERKYKLGEMYEVWVQLTADAFGSTEGTIISFYDIDVTVSILRDSYNKTEFITLPDIVTVGGSESTTFIFNLSDITSDDFDVEVNYRFKGNNTEGTDPDYVSGMGVREVVVKTAANLIFPLLAVLSLGVLVLRRVKK